MMLNDRGSDQRTYKCGVLKYDHLSPPRMTVSVIAGFALRFLRVLNWHHITMVVFFLFSQPPGVFPYFHEEQLQKDFAFSQR